MMTATVSRDERIDRFQTTQMVVTFQLYVNETLTTLSRARREEDTKKEDAKFYFIKTQTKSIPYGSMWLRPSFIDNTCRGKLNLAQEDIQHR